MNLLFIAPPAAGKGTIAELMHKKYNLVNISVGQLLRDVNPGTEMGKKIRETQAEGKLVDNTITGLLLRQRLQRDDIKNGFILDGFPREMAQVELLEEIEKGLNIKIDYAVHLMIPFEVALKRTLGRQVCPKCKKSYNRFTEFAPRVENMCDVCNIELENRNDDNEESLRQRFALFNEKTYPVIEYYKDKGMLVEVDSSKDANSVLQELEERLGLNG